MTPACAPGDGRVIAIDIGGGTTKVALVDRAGTLAGWHSFPTRARDSAAFLDTLLHAVERAHLASSGEVVGIGLAMAGFVSEQGVLVYNPNLPWLEHAPIAATLEDRLGLAVHAETDSNAACVAEYIFGHGQGASRFLCLTGGTGIGVGMVVDGHLLRVAHDGMGDAGHVIVAPGGPICSCGGRGCAEALLSTQRLGQRYAEMKGEQSSFIALVTGGRSGEPHALKLLREAGHALGILAASLSHIFFPDRIAIAGGLSQAGESLLTPAQETFQGSCGHLPRASASLVCASTGAHATLLGAAACCFYPELGACSR